MQSSNFSYNKKLHAHIPKMYIFKYHKQVQCERSKKNKYKDCYYCQGILSNIFALKLIAYIAYIDLDLILLTGSEMN